MVKIMFYESTPECEMLHFNTLHLGEVWDVTCQRTIFKGTIEIVKLRFEVVEDCLHAQTWNEW